MQRGIIKAPFFEVGPKAFLYGEKMLKLALELDRIALKYNVDIILTPQYTDIYPLAQKTKHIHIFAQHMDCLSVGRGLGSVLPEAVKAAGADGVMLNHAEKKLTLEVIGKTIIRAKEVGLLTIVCGDTIEELQAIARLNPDMIVAEPTELIGTGRMSDLSYIKDCIKIIKDINPEIMVLPAAGIGNGNDVYNVIKAGAEATGSTSGIIKAPNPAAMAEEMISAVRRAWDERNAF